MKKILKKMMLIVLLAFILCASIGLYPKIKICNDLKNANNIIITGNYKNLTFDNLGEVSGSFAGNMINNKLHVIICDTKSNPMLELYKELSAEEGDYIINISMLINYFSSSILDETITKFINLKNDYYISETQLTQVTGNKIDASFSGLTIKDINGIDLLFSNHIKYTSKSIIIKQSNFELTLLPSSENNEIIIPKVNVNEDYLDIFKTIIKIIKK